MILLKDRNGRDKTVESVEEFCKELYSLSVKVPSVIVFMDITKLNSLYTKGTAVTRLHKNQTKSIDKRKLNCEIQYQQN